MSRFPSAHSASRLIPRRGLWELPLPPLLPLLPLPLGRRGRGRFAELEELHHPPRLLERAANKRRLRQQAELLQRLLQKLLLLVPFLSQQKGLAQQELHESRVVHLTTASQEEEADLWSAGFLHAPHPAAAAQDPQGLLAAVHPKSSPSFVSVGRRAKPAPITAADSSAATVIRSCRSHERNRRSRRRLAAPARATLDITRLGLHGKATQKVTLE